jgi:hypothetical protein
MSQETAGVCSHPDHRAPRTMDASDSTPRAGESDDGCIAFVDYLQVIARSELDRAAGELQTDAYAFAHPNKPQVSREPSLADLRRDARELRNAIRFLELIQEMRESSDCCWSAAQRHST